MVPYNLLILCLHVNLGAILAQGTSYIRGNSQTNGQTSQENSRGGFGQTNGMNVMYEWKSVDFTWPSSKAKDIAVKQGRYDPTRVAILDVDIYDPSKYDQYPNSEQKIFVSTPKFQPKIPVTLSTVSSKRAKDGSYLLEPFPNWSTHSEKGCDGLISVYRVQVDECGKLWVLDTGKLYTFTSAPQTLCPPQIVVYDLTKGNKVVMRHRFPDSVLEANSLPITIAVDSRDQCAAQFAYCADVNGYQMLVFDAARNRSWRVTSNYFHPFPNHGTFNLNGAEFDLMDGVFAIALGPLVNNNRRVYFHALASLKEAWTYSSTLLNQSLFDNNLTPTALFELSPYDRNSQSTVEVVNDEGIMFFPLLISNSLACWNTKTVYKQENFATVYKNDQLFQFLSGMKLKDNRDLYILTSRLQNYIVTSVTDVSQVNYRVLTARTADLTRKTACDVTRFDSTGYLPQNGAAGGGYGTVHRRPQTSPFNAQGSKFWSNYSGMKNKMPPAGSGVSGETEDAFSDIPVAPSNSQFTPSNNQKAPVNSQFAPVNNQKAPSNSQVAPSNYQKAPSNSQAGPSASYASPIIFPS